jgi:hypothetical protein
MPSHGIHRPGCLHLRHSFRLRESLLLDGSSWHDLAVARDLDSCRSRGFPSYYYCDFPAALSGYERIIFPSYQVRSSLEFNGKSC